MTRFRQLWFWAFAAAHTIAVTVSVKADAAEAETGGTNPYIVGPGQLKWTDPPAGVARGVPSVESGGHLAYAAMQGDPLNPSVPYAIRLKCPDGCMAAPHWHPEDENIVVLQGTFSVG